MPRMKFKPDQNLIPVEGFLSTYFETGMEHLGVVLIDPSKDQPNPNFGVAGHYSEKLKAFHTWEGTHFVDAKNAVVLEILNKAGRVYRRLFLKTDREAAAVDQYRLGHAYFVGVPSRTLARWVSKEQPARLWRRAQISDVLQQLREKLELNRQALAERLNLTTRELYATEFLTSDDRLRTNASHLKVSARILALDLVVTEALRLEPTFTASQLRSLLDNGRVAMGGDDPDASSVALISYVELYPGAEDLKARTSEALRYFRGL